MIGAPKLLYESRFNDAVPVASTTAAGYSVLNLLDMRPYTWWKPTAMPATVTVDCGTVQSADYCAVYGHNMFGLATIEVRGSTDNFGASDVLIATTTPPNNNPFVLFFPSVSYRYWRARFTGSIPNLAMVLVGRALTFERPLRSGFDPLGRSAVGTVNTAVQGFPLGSILNFEKFEDTLKIERATQAWGRATWLAAWNAHLRDKPFIFAWDPSDHADELFLVSSKGSFKAAHIDEGLLDLELSLTGAVP